jgi:hypothetical protein
VAFVAFRACEEFLGTVGCHGIEAFGRERKEADRIGGDWEIEAFGKERRGVGRAARFARVRQVGSSSEGSEVVKRQGS